MSTAGNGRPFAGRYDLLRELGRGGMGVVHLAYDREMHREVALKTIRGGGPGSEERFRREYRALAAIRHSGVPAILHSGRTDEGEAFFTMEIVSGETLLRVLERGPIEPVRALALAIDLGRVLAAVHAAGVVHRDVKPHNLIIEPGDRVRLIDFGACLLTGDYFRKPHLRGITATGERFETGELEFVGTASYTDPECYTEGTTTPRSDVFSVCVVLYEMITGRRLFDDSRHRFREIDPREFPRELAGLAAELRRGVALPSFERHASMNDLVRRLEVIRAELSTPGRATIRRVLLGALGAAALGAAGWIGRASAPTVAPAEREVAAVVREPTTTERTAIERTAPAAIDASRTPPPLPTMREALAAAAPNLRRCADVAGGFLMLEFVVREGDRKFAAVNVPGSPDVDVGPCVREATAAIVFTPTEAQTFTEEYAP